MFNLCIAISGISHLAIFIIRLTRIKCIIPPMLGWFLTGTKMAGGWVTPAVYWRAQ